MGEGPGFTAEFEAARARFRFALEGACERSAPWPERVAAALAAALRFAADNPDTVDVLTNRALAAGPDGVAAHRRLLDWLAGLLAPGRRERPENADLPRTLELALLGGLASLVAQRLSAGRAAELPALAPEATELVLAPYLGPVEAKRLGGGTR